MIHFSVDIEPMGAVRMTRKGKFIDPAAQRYLAYKNVIGWEAKKQTRLETPFTSAVRITHITYKMPIPKNGLSGYKENGKRKNRKVKEGDFHTVRPDTDNLYKGLTDSLNGIIWEDDSLICDIGRQLKIYAECPGIEIEVEEITP